MAIKNKVADKSKKKIQDESKSIHKKKKSGRQDCQTKRTFVCY